MLYYTLTSSLMFLELSNVNNTYKLYSYPTASKIASNTSQYGIIIKTKITRNNSQRTVFSVSLVKS